jgi:4-hydroxy-tetrahydrodipicolinate synthase
MKQINLKGTGVALVTPFLASGKIDEETLLQLIDYQLQNDTDYLVVLGTTAETPTLFSDEQEEIRQAVVSKVQGRMPLVLGVSGNHTQSIVKKLESDRFSGFDAILSVVPYYNKPSQEGIYQHYKHIAAAASLPVILYNVPGRTGVNMTAETTLRLAHDFNNIIAIKEASGNTTQISAIIRNKPRDFQVISGDDAATLPLISLGAAGVISVIANAFPKEFNRMVHLALAGNYAEAADIHLSFLELFGLLFADGSPAGIKCVLKIAGYGENILRLPLVPVQAATEEKIQAAMQIFRRKFPYF